MQAITATPVTVNFHGTAIQTFNVAGIIRVAMRPICDAIGLDWEGQRQRIRRHPVLSQGACMIKAPSNSGIQKALTLPLNKLNGWLFGVDTGRVKPAIREKLVEYQAECFDVLNDYWQKGEAVNPRLSDTEDRKPLNRAVRTLANLRSAQGDAADYAGMWKLVNGYLGVEHIADATEDQVERAMAFVQESIERESRRIIEGDWLARDTPSVPAAPGEVIDYPSVRRWHEWQPHQLIGNDVDYHSGMSRLLKQLAAAQREGAAITVADMGGIREELLALRHLAESLKIERSLHEGRATKRETLAKHCQVIEREWRAAVGPAVHSLNPGLAASLGDRIAGARRMAESL